MAASPMDWRLLNEALKMKSQCSEPFEDTTSHDLAAVINDIQSRLCSGTKIIQLVGLPLVGKSYLAHKMAADLTRHVILLLGCELNVHTIHFRGRVSSILHLREVIIHSLNCNDQGIATSHRRFLRVLERIPGMHLFIFENVEVISENNDLQNEFLDLCTDICHGSECLRVVITTRQRYSLQREPSMFQTIAVQPLSVEESRHLFRSITGDIGLWEHQLVPLCTGIPYVLVIVAKAIRDHMYTPGEMLSILKSTDLPTFATKSADEGDLQREFEKCLQKLTDVYLKKRCAELVYIPGTFSPEAAAYITGSSIAATKHDVIEPLHSISLVLRGDPQCERFQMHKFIRALVEDHYGLLRDDSLIRNRYCRFFAQLLQRLTPLADRSRGQKFHLLTQELTNLEKLLQEAVHLIDEHYELFFDIAYNGEYHIINLMPKKESVDFYEALMNTAKLKDQRQYGILLSSFGQVLNFAQTRYSKAYDQYMKSLDYLSPLGDSNDLAWLYSHIGYFWFELGHFKKAERYGLMAYKMIKRVRQQVSEEKKWYEESRLKMPQGLIQKDFMTDKITGSILSTLGLAYSELGRSHEAVHYHHECLNLRWIIYGFHPTLGSCYNNLSEAYEKMGNFQKALEHAHIGMNIKKHFMKDPSNAVIESLLATARLTTRTGGDTHYALSLLREAYEMRSVLGLPHAQALCILYEEGRIWYYRKEFQKAVETLQNAVEMHGQMESPRRQKGETLRLLGLALRSAGQLNKAKEMLAKSIEEQELIPEGEKIDEDTVKTVTTLNELTSVKNLLA